MACDHRMEDLRRRFESPNESNRWDKPLFQVNMMAAIHPTIPTATDKDDTDTLVLVASEDTTKSSLSDKPFPVATDGDAGARTSQPLVATKNGHGDNLVQLEVQLQSSAPPHIPTTTVFSSWKSKKAKAKPHTDDGSVSTQQTVSSSSCFIKKSTANSNVYFSGSRAVDEVVLTDDGPEDVIKLICAYFHTAEAPQPTAATNTVRHSNAHLLYQIDKVSQTITQNIVLHQQKQSPGTPLVFREYNSYSLTLPRHVSMAELQRHRRQYLKVSSQHPPDTAEDIGNHFLEFLSNQF